MRRDYAKRVSTGDSSATEESREEKVIYMLRKSRDGKRDGIERAKKATSTDDSLPRSPGRCEFLRHPERASIDGRACNRPGELAKSV